MSSSKKTPEQPLAEPLAESGGQRSRAVDFDDPYRALDELMAVVEALCQEWPARRCFDGTERMLL